MTPATRTLRFPIVEQTQVGEARRAVAQLAAFTGLNETNAGRAAILVTEAGTNLIKHAKGGGQIFLHASTVAGSSTVDVLSVDKGPGMPDLDRCLQDGYSTAGSPGNGLGAIRRMADEFDIYSRAGEGTVLFARIQEKALALPIDLGAINLAVASEKECGDAWSLRTDGQAISLLVVDGLGHGREAALAAQEAVRVFDSDRALQGPAALDEMHRALKMTRGAAVGLARVNRESRTLAFAGVGNISCMLLDSMGDSRSIASQHGIVGHQMPRAQEYSISWPARGLLIMHSDGLSGRWRPQNYPGLWSRHPALIAALLCRDFGRERDDMSVILFREKP